MKARVLVAVLALGAAACSPPAPAEEAHAVEPAIVHAPSGGAITLPIRVATEHEVDGTRESFRTEDGVVWSVQTIERSADAPAASLDEIAIALCRRVELGEVEGELTHRDCTFGGQQGQCIEGWQTSRSGERILRRGAIVHAGSDVVWISLAIRDGAGAVDSLAESLATETLVQGAP